MKQTPPNDPLDQEIDSLLANQPLAASEPFTAKVMDAIHAETRQAPPKRTAPILRFTLPLAAAVLLSVLLWNAYTLKSPLDSTTLTAAETEEIFLLEASLRHLSDAQDNSPFKTDGMLAILETAAFSL